ncbi:MAG: DoxX-like family [Verrucomicrobiota bacterium]|jgi:hypothetical protein
MNRFLYHPAESGPALLALSVLAILLGAFYLFLAQKNLRGDAQMIADYRRWGCSESFRLFVGLGQLSFGLLLCCRPLCFWGALPLAMMMLGAVGIHVRHDRQPRTWVAAALCGLLCAGLAIYFRPELLRG